jgi:hypothetical protein
MSQQKPLDEICEPPIEDQYISVLLEYYCVRQETLGHSRMDQAKVTYWKSVVGFFEKERLGNARRRLERQLSRWERLPLGPVEMALLRYAWGAYLTDSETDDQVINRWRRYFAVDLEAEQPSPCAAKVVSWDHFRRRQLFETARRSTRLSGLWPWP